MAQVVPAAAAGGPGTLRVGPGPGPPFRVKLAGPGNKPEWTHLTSLRLASSSALILHTPHLVWKSPGPDFVWIYHRAPARQAGVWAARSAWAARLRPPTRGGD